MPHDSPEKPPSQNDSIMDELESIKDLLDKDAGPATAEGATAKASFGDGPLAHRNVDSCSRLTREFAIGDHGRTCRQRIARRVDYIAAKSQILNKIGHTAGMH